MIFFLLARDKIGRKKSFNFLIFFRGGKSEYKDGSNRRRTKFFARDFRILTDDERFSRFSVFLFRRTRNFNDFRRKKRVAHFHDFFDQEGIKLGLDALLFLKFDKSLKLEAPGNGTSKMISFFSKSLNFHQVNFSYFVT